ncbi:hypothetical protein OZX61_00525 [Acinetobacter sp. ESL0695]|uniref:Uncharacterized protein n=1 Tax=Acinetobacter pollinis TaxID=2605270 RepID=A0ABU6DTG2_9GAMM|nr:MULTISPECIES: AciT family ciprofloxacin tolerance protein [Acinetobacter]MEB5477146.1 hypothetical protein [Acinetobacter pollinis]WEV49010.1 hypothetical protein OZX61_00525 [Acinetobacter sp. ESL0695]
MLTASFASMVGTFLIMIALVSVYFSPYRHWLGFMLAGMVFWGAIEIMRLSIQYTLQCSISSSYLISAFIGMIGLLFVLLRLNRVEQKTIANRQLIEHTPVYDDKQ